MIDDRTVERLETVAERDDESIRTLDDALETIGTAGAVDSGSDSGTADDATEFCPACGTELDADPAPNFCRNCGQEL